MGKSTVVDALRGQPEQWPVFDADATVAKLLTDREIGQKIEAEFGEPALNEDGSVNRPFLREQVFDSVERRAALEDILHPEVRNDFEETRARAADGGATALVADIPLFFESRSPYPADAVVVVAADPSTQLSRLRSRPGISEETAAKMVAAQLPVAEKMAAADVVVWNSGSRRQLDTQTQFLNQWLKTKTN